MVPDMSEARWEAYEDPDVGRWRDWKAKRAITEAETRRYLRGEYDPAEEPTSPAQRALVRAARSEDEKAREAARLNWPTTEGWMEPTDEG
jgi:hypothetical protein